MPVSLSPPPGLSSSPAFKRSSSRWESRWSTANYTSKLPSGAMVASSAVWRWVEQHSISSQHCSATKSVSHPSFMRCAIGGLGFHARLQPEKTGTWLHYIIGNMDNQCVSLCVRLAPPHCKRVCKGWCNLSQFKRWITCHIRARGTIGNNYNATSNNLN